MDPAEPQTAGSLRARARLWTERFRADAQRVEERAQAERERHRWVDAVFDMVDHDGDVAGGIIAGALAYRLFIWLLPLALVAVAGLGFAADASSGTPQDAAESLGLQGLVTNSVANAAKGSSRWYALLIGVPVLIWATRSVLRVLISAHRLVWGEARALSPKPRLGPTFLLLAALLGFALVSTLATAVRSWSDGPGVLATLVAVVPYAGLWLLVSLQLPHRGTDWTALVPGALVYAVGANVLHVVIAYVITPMALAKQGTYGALGIAAALLIALFLISRLIVAAAVVNATLWERRASTQSREAQPSRPAASR
jgi:uncharacterized BrkB/YihY/UPF0761 family membrane protein